MSDAESPAPLYARLPIIRRWTDPDPMVPVVRLSGAIGGFSRVRDGLSMQAMAGVLQRAFSIKRAPAVALAINSPGGSPVQATLIYKRIRALSEEKEKPVFAFCEDVAASGGYLIACAADEIWAEESSIVGSIGVISSGFGFVETLNKLGVERRMHVSGERKGMLDPFSPERDAHVEHLKSIQSEVHEAFKDIVRASRGEKLAVDGEEPLFDGAFWTGRRGRELGLIDEIGDIRSAMRDRFGEKVQLRVVNPRRIPLISRLTRGMGGELRSIAGAPATLMGGDLAAGLLDGLEERALWSRYGL